MRTRVLAAMAALAMTMIAPASARPFNLAKMLGNPESDAALDTFKLIRVADLAKVMAKPGSRVAIYDANLADTRAKYGIIPGAHLLPSSNRYNVAQELPADKAAKLVFYCANTH
jgi:hypothetical protein